MQTALLNNRTIVVTKKLTQIFSCVLFIAIASQISIPLIPVPLTLQTISVLFIGALFGWEIGLSSVLLYITAGALGLPIFAGFSAGLLGASVGYLIGFIPAVVLCGIFYNRHSNWVRNLSVFLLSDFIIFSFGTLWLGIYFSWHDAYWFGIAPFIFTEIAKIVFLTLVTANRR